MSMKDKIQQFGLTEVYCSPNPQVDVVFVHGLNGNPYKTWATQKPDVYWPADLLPQSVEDQHCRILTYGYDANVTAFTDGTSKDHIHNHAEHLAARLVANRSVKARERPLVFIAHSLGGLVVKRLLIYCESINNPKLERLRSIYVSTFGILFLGTPHNGSDLAKWGSLLQSICSVALPKKLLDTSPQLVNALKSNNETLQNINRLFIEILDPLRIYFFHESKPTDLKGTMQFIVDEDSAAPVMQGVERMGIEKDHSHMCKFEDSNAPGYDVVADAVSSYAEEAPAKVKGRWEREKHVREYHRQSIASELLGDSILNIAQTQTSHNSAQESQRTSMGARPPRMLLTGKSAQSPYEVEEYDELQDLPIPVSSVQSVKLLEASASASASQSSKQTPRVAPLLFRPNSVFVGFDIELTRLERKLQAEEKKKIGTCPVLICGPPGSGKSHLAREYVWTHQADYPAGIFWVDCKSKENTVRYYWDIGQALGCLDGDNSKTFQSDRSFIAEVRKRLESLQGWLIVFDGIFFNSDDALSDFVRYIPDSPGNCIIYTSVDPTLKRRHRLLNPSSIRLLPLRPDAACELLFKIMGIHKHTTTQRQKAEELVHYYGCLPLGIHAAAHMLRAQGRVLEKFSPVTSDQRLLNPFLEILRALEREGDTEAITLLGLLSMLNHKVPVALLNFGTAAIEEAGLDIRSLEQGGGVRRDLDNSISILLKYGVVERELQTYSVSTSEQSRTSPLMSRTATATHLSYSSPLITPQPSQATDDSGGLEFMVDEEAKGSAESTTSISITIDTLRTHTVTQTVILEEIKTRGLNKMSYDEWRILACQFLCGSYEFASKRLRSLPGQGSVADYREYKAHATLLWKLLPRSHKQASASLTKARNELLGMIRDIQREIHARSPSHSQSSHEDRFRILGSVFENSASSSDEGAHTPNSDLTRASTWSSGRFDFRSESPTRFANSQHADDGVISDLEDEGYTTDYEDLRSNLQTSQRWGAASATTAVPVYSAEGSPRQSFLYTMLPYSRKKDLGEFKPMPVVGVSNPEVRPTRLRSSSSSATSFSWPFRRSSASQSAEGALAAVQAKTPFVPAQLSDSRKTSSSSESRERPKLVSRQPLGERSSNTTLPIITGASDHLPLDMAAKPRQASIQYNGITSTSPRLINALLERQAVLARESVPDAKDFSTIQQHSRMSNTAALSSSTSDPRLFDSIPSGYSSLPMSRDTSRESGHSLVSAPAKSSQTTTHLKSDYLESYEYPRRVLPSIDRFLRRSVDLGHSGGWTYPSPSGCEDEMTQEFDLVIPASKTAPTSPNIGLHSDGHYNGVSEANKSNKGKEKEHIGLHD